MLHVETGCTKELAQRVSAARFEARFGGAVVDTTIADQLLQQLDGLSGQIWSRHVLRLPFSFRSPRMIQQELQYDHTGVEVGVRITNEARVRVCMAHSRVRCAGHGHKTDLCAVVAVRPLCDREVGVGCVA